MGVSNFDAVTTSGNVSAGGNVAATGNVTAGGNVVATGSISATGDLKSKSVLSFFVPGAQVTGTLLAAALVPFAGVITDVRARVVTAPTGATLIVDVNKSGTTIFSTQANRPTVAISGFSSTTTAPNVTSVAAGDYISVDVDQVGSSVAGADLMVSVTIKRS